MAVAKAHPESRPTPNRLQRWIQALAMIPWVTRAVAPLVQAVDRRLLAWTGDRWCLTSSLTGLPVLRITTTGARTGRRRTHPLTVLAEGDRWGLIGSNFGRQHAPSWVHNLRAHPVAEVLQADGPRRCHARPATADEYERFWRRAVELYPGYAAYATRAAPRRVPIFVLTPPSDSSRRGPAHET